MSIVSLSPTEFGYNPLIIRPAGSILHVNDLQASICNNCLECLLNHTIDILQKMNDQQLKILIKLNQIPQPPASAIADNSEANGSDNEEKLPFDWFKISAAILLLIMVIVFSYWILTSSEKESDESLIYLNEDTNQSADSNQELSDLKSTADATSPETISGTAIASNLGQQIETVRNTVLSSENNAKLAIVTPLSKPESKALKLNGQQSKEKSTHARSNHLIKAQLTTSPQKQESINSIDHIELQRGANQTVYYFLHIRNLKGKKIFVHWYYQDKQIAKIPFSINANDWQAHASKILTKTRLGRWRVSAMDQSGNILSEQFFVVSNRT